MEKADFKSFTHVPARKHVAGKDGDVEVLVHEAEEQIGGIEGTCLEGTMLWRAFWPRRLNLTTA